MKAIAAEDSAARRVLRACAFLRLHKWDAAYADMAKANKMDPTDSQLKEWLPQFERLQKFLPRIKALDAQISKSPNDVTLLLDRARQKFLRSEEHTSELQSRLHLVCRLLLEKKKNDSIMPSSPA